MKVKIAQALGLPPNHFLDTESDRTTERRADTDAMTDETTREKGVIGDVENIVSRACREMDEEKKSQVVESIQGILNTIEKNRRS